MNEDQINELKSLVDELTTQGLSTADIQSRVDQRKAEFAETVKVTDEIQTTPTEGKTSDVAVVDAAVTSEPDTASESTESEPDDILSGLEKIKDVREIDKRIDKITSTKATKFFEAGEISPLDSPKRIAQYKELINRRNNIIGDTYKLGQTQTYQQKDFDPMSPSKKVIEREGAPEGGAKLAYVPFTVDGEVVGTTMEPLAFEEVVVTAEQYKERERQIQSEAYINFLEQSGLSTEPLSREEFEAEKEKEGDITEIKTTPYRGLDLLQSFENIGASLSGLQQTAQEKEDFRNQYEDYLSFVKDEKVDVKREVPRFLPSIGATVSNTLLQIGGTDDRALLNLAYLTNSISSDTYRNIFGVNIGDKLKEQAVKGLGTIDTKINYLNSLTGDVAQFTDIPDVEGVKKATSGLAATLNAISSFGATVATAIPTSGYSIYSDMIANNIKSFNDAKAQRLGIDVTELANQGETEILIPATLGTIGAQLEKLGIKGVGRAINKMSPGAMRTVFALFNSGTPESATEWSQTQLETYNEALGKGLTNNEAVDLVVKEMTSKQSIESALQGFAGGGGTVLSSSLIKSASSLRTPSENKRVSNLINKLNELENSKYRKNLNADDIAQINTAQEEIRVNLRDIVLSNNELAGSLTPAQIQQVDIASDYLTSSTSRINEIEASDKYSEQDKENIIASINQKRKIASDVIYDIRNEAEKLEAQVFTIKDLSKFVKGVKVEEAKDEADALKFVDDNNLEIKASTEQGYVLQNPETGEQTIVINKETAQNQQAVNVAAHEFLHALLYSTIKNNPKAATNLGRSLIAELNKIDVDQIEDSDFKKRMQQYADKPLEEQMEEAITLFSDALVTGDIKFKENIATRIGDKFRRLSQKFGVKIKFNNGRDVYNFVKDYNKSIEKGKLSIAQVRAAAKGVEGELVTPVTEQQTEQIIKESRTEEQTERNKDLMQRAKEGDVLAANDLVQENSGLILRLLKFNPDTAQQSGVTSDDILQAVTDMMTPGMVDITFPGRKKSLVEEYKESDGEVSTFLGRLGQRQAEIYTAAGLDPNKFTTERIDAPEARQVAAEEVVTETAVKPEAKAIDPFRIMPDVKETAIAEVQKSIADKDVDVTTVTYKELKDVAPYQTVADFFNIPVSRITNPKDNLRKSDDVANIQRWILKNEPTLKNLFTEANRDVIEVTEGNRVIRQGGEPTAIPRNLLNKFYTKGDRVGNNFQWKLKPYDRTTFLESVGIKEGKVDPNFTPRAAEAQTIKGILDMYTRNLGNVIARETIEAREDITLAEKARAKAEVAKGKPRIMMAKEYEQKTTETFDNILMEEQDLSKRTEEELARENKVWKKIIQDTSKRLGVDLQFIDSKNEADVVKFKNFVLTELPKFMPKSFFTAGTFYNAGESGPKRGFFFTSKEQFDSFLKDTKFAPESKAIEAAATRQTLTTGSGVNRKASPGAIKLFKSGEIKKQNALKLKGLKEIFSRFEQMIKDNPENAQYIVAMLSSTSQSMNHFVRVAAPFNFISTDLEGNVIVEEHTLPASLVAKYLFGQAVNGTVNKNFKNIENNYFQGLLSKQNDNKLKGKTLDGKPYNYISTPPFGWKITDNIWARYFNANVANNNFGIDPNVIILADGKSVADKFNINSSGGLVTKKFNTEQQNAAKVNNKKITSSARVKYAKSMPDVLGKMSELDSEANKANKEYFDSADLNKGFNDILEQTTGIASEKRYKRVKAEVAGAARGKAIRGIPYSAQDLVGLLYETLGKGKLGDAQMAWYKENLLKPYAKAMNEIDAARLSMMNDYRALKKELKVVPKDLRKKIPGEPFTQEQAVRVYIWNQQGMEVPGISETDLKDLTDFVENNEDLKTFADQLIYIQKSDEYAKPKEGWPAGSITTDLLENINTVKRAKYLEQWQANVDEIFSEENMNKLEAAYGKKYRKAMENMLGRMKTGRNRSFSDDSLTGRFTDWLQGSIGTIMFFNTRSALLQTISSINFVNFTDNNPLAAAKAFGNQKQFWSDFVTLINSDFLKARRSGLRMNVNEADIADMAKKGGPRAVINKLLQLGFAPTQIADSFAIASGGATFYRNRINTYKKQGLSQQEAETKAFEDFRENAEESQQSARPDRISMQQAGGLGRLILAFQNTPSQYARIIDKSVRDLKNGRGDAKTNISKIIYYSTVQNLLFNALQQALFAFAFDDEEPEDKEKEEKYVDIANSMMDSLLRGTGIAGGILSVGKNAILRIVRESEKARPNYEKVGADLLKIAPPVSSKLSKINQAARSYKWDKEEMKEKGWSLDSPAYLAGANVISALTNVPLDRGIKKANNVVNATDSDLETWERLALLGGWQDWEIGVDEENKTNKPQPRKSTSKFKKSKIK